MNSPNNLFDSNENLAETCSDRKIAYLVSEYPKISHTFIRREINALERRGWKVARFSVRGWKSTLVDAADVAERNLTSYILKSGILALAFSAIYYLLNHPKRLAGALLLSMKMMRYSDRPKVYHLVYFVEACWLSRQLKRLRIRHLHAHFGTNPAEVAMLTQKLSGIPFSFTVHGPEEFDKARTIHLAEKIVKSRFVIAVCSFGRSQIYRVLDTPNWSKVHVVHCSVDDLFTMPGTELDTRSRKFVCVGRLCEQKGQALLVMVAAKLRDEGLNFHINLIGDGEDRSALEKLILDLSLRDIVTISGWASSASIREHLLSARALVLPSFAEGLPVVIMEAMSLARPVIATFVAGHPELVVPGHTGWLVPAGSIEGLADALRECLAMPESELVSLGSLGRERAMRRHNADKEAKLLEQLFVGSMNA